MRFGGEIDKIISPLFLPQKNSSYRPCAFYFFEGNFRYHAALYSPAVYPALCCAA